jgi:hypothetical protein
MLSVYVNVLPFALCVCSIVAFEWLKKLFLSSNQWMILTFESWYLVMLISIRLCFMYANMYN